MGSSIHITDATCEELKAFAEYYTQEGSDAQ
jgi:hypothetical protein